MYSARSSALSRSHRYPFIVAESLADFLGCLRRYILWIGRMLQVRNVVRCLLGNNVERGGSHLHDVGSLKSSKLLSEMPGLAVVSNGHDTAILNISCHYLLKDFQRDLEFCSMVDVFWNGSVRSALGESFPFLLTLITCNRLLPFHCFGRNSRIPKGLCDLISIVPFARVGERAIDKFGVAALDSVENPCPACRPKVLVLPRAFLDKPFESFLIHLQFLSEIGDSSGRPGATGPGSIALNSARFVRASAMSIHPTWL